MRERHKNSRAQNFYVLLCIVDSVTLLSNKLVLFISRAINLFMLISKTTVIIVQGAPKKLDFFRF